MKIESSHDYEYSGTCDSTRNHYSNNYSQTTIIGEIISTRVSSKGIKKLLHKKKSRRDKHGGDDPVVNAPTNQPCDTSKTPSNRNQSETSRDNNTNNSTRQPLPNNDKKDLPKTNDTNHPQVNDDKDKKERGNHHNHSDNDKDKKDAKK